MRIDASERPVMNRRSVVLCTVEDNAAGLAGRFGRRKTPVGRTILPEFPDGTLRCIFS
jgi:hypothetical protein